MAFDGRIIMTKIICIQESDGVNCMILKYLLNTFKHIVFYDSEYRQNIKEKGERPHVVCIVYKDYVTGKIHRAYGADINKHPYPIMKLCL